jgi:alpha-1,6-mannosyltransferase
MRIVQIANFYTPVSGGLRTSLDEIGRRYGELGHERVLLVPGPRDSDEITPAGRRVTVRSPELPGRGGYRVLAHRSRVLDRLDRLRPDVLEVSDKIVLGWVSGWAAERGVPALLFSHERIDAILSGWLPAWLPLEPAVDRVNRRLVRLADRVVVTSRFAREEFDRVGAGDVRLVPLGVDLDLFRPADSPMGRRGRSVQLITVGRLSREKRPELAIDTLRVLHRSGVAAGLLVVGDGPIRAALRRHAGDLPIRFLGHVPDRRGLSRLLAAADVAVAPCPVETFGLAVLEAMACGTPVVVPDAGAAHELLGRRGSGVVTDGSADGLAAGVQALLDVPPGERRQAARARAEDFPWSATVTALLAAHGAAAPVPAGLAAAGG